MALQAGLGESFMQWLPSFMSELPTVTSALTPPVPSLNTLPRTALQLVTGAGSLGTATLFQLVLLGSIGLLYWSWLASWWALQPRHSLASPNLSTQHVQKGA
jgi:hypothetical protein